MKRFKINTTFEEDEKERIDFFAGLSYSERLRHYFKLRRIFPVKTENNLKGRIFVIYHSHGAI